MISFYSHALFFQKQKKVKDFETNLKSFANPLLKNSAKLFSSYELAKRSFNFNDIGEDLLYKTEFSSVEELSCLSKGFTKIPYRDYAYSTPQSFLDEISVKNINFDMFDKFTFSLLEFSLSYKDNELFFILDGEIFISVRYPQNTKILFAGIDPNHFLNIIFEINSKQYFYKTHLSYDFYEYEFDNIITTFIENTEHVNFCEIPTFDFDKTKLFFSDYSGIYLKNENKTFSKLPFYKKFYFVNDGYVYRNILPSELLSLDSQKIIKVEHLYFYDLISLFGLNEIKDELNLTSYQLDYLKNINFEFGNHFNGFQNFFNLSNFSTNGNFISLENDYFKIVGNLKDVFGDCSLSISYYSDDNCICYLQTSDKIRSSNVYFSEGVCYFKNLKIYKKFKTNSKPVKSKFDFNSQKSEYHMAEKEINKNEFTSTYNLDTENFELSAFSDIVPTIASPQIVFKDSDLYIKYSDERFEKLGIVSDGNFSPLLETLSKNTYSIVDKTEVKTKSLTLEKTETPAFTVSKNSFALKFSDFNI